MSVKNKARDRGSNGKIRRKYTSPGRIYNKTPKWWVKMFMTRPRRRQSTWACKAVMRGVDPDAMVWPTGNRRPHLWY